MFRKILVANRGEIARRIIHAIREMSIKSVAIYSDPDIQSLHRIEADEAYPLNGIESTETYLDISKIIDIARAANADAIHPGYGFLSENAEFAEACKKAQITFIGPSVSTIRLLGSKIASKELARRVHAPLVPGFEGALPEGKELKEIANKIGYPLLVKAAAGGGGKGMRIVKDASLLEEQIIGAKREAIAFFKDETLFLERYFENPKHIEIQILGDQHGHLIHLFERECSIQRRHQKMIEESPAPLLKPELRQKICETALNIARAVKYDSAGTVEFLLDQDENFYFLEVNTRLQVEHPITELVTGIDLVKAQIEIAAGKPLRFQQKDLVQKGHAIECRLYAEDPERDFLPVEGEIAVLDEPSRPGVRIDSSLKQGQALLPYYDPMLAKLIVWAETRSDAIEKMKALLADYTLLGLPHNLDFLRFILQTEGFKNGDYHTHSVAKDLFTFKETRKTLPELAWFVAALAQAKPKIKSSTESIQNGLTSLLEAIAGFRNV